jgi:hypothetical protein
VISRLESLLSPRFSSKAVKLLVIVVFNTRTITRLAIALMKGIKLAGMKEIGQWYALLYG